jgi:hypothetical protein
MAVEARISIEYSRYKLLLEQSKKLQDLLNAPRREEGIAPGSAENQDSAGSAGSLQGGGPILPDLAVSKKKMPPPSVDIRAPDDEPTLVQKSIGEPSDRKITLQNQYEPSTSSMEEVKMPKRHKGVIDNEKRGFPYYFLGSGPFSEAEQDVYV